MNAPFSPEAMTIVIQSLIIMAKGMLGIFVFMSIFYLLIWVLNRIYKTPTLPPNAE